MSLLYSNTGALLTPSGDTYAVNYVRFSAESLMRLRKRSTSKRRNCGLCEKLHSTLRYLSKRRSFKRRKANASK